MQDASKQYGSKQHLPLALLPPFQVHQDFQKQSHWRKALANLGGGLCLQTTVQEAAPLGMVNAHASQDIYRAHLESSRWFDICLSQFRAVVGKQKQH